MFGELKDGLPVSLEALHMEVLGRGIIMQHIAVGPQGKHLMDHQVTHALKQCDLTNKGEEH